MIGLTFQIELLAPLLIGQFGAGDENSEASFDYIPGSSLRGLFIHRYIETTKQDIRHAPDALENRLFFSNQVRYLNAYPSTKAGHRTLPTPGAWRIEKELADQDDATVYDGALRNLEDLEKSEGVGSPFCYLDGSQVTLYTPTRRIGLHNASTQRFVKAAEDSTVFRYDALEAGQIFSGVVVCEERAMLEENLLPLLDDPALFLGRSRSAEYGRARLLNVQISDGWQEYAASTDSVPKALTLTLLSDAILRDAHGQFTLDLKEGCGLAEAPEMAFAAAGVAGSFNRTWGLPMVQAPVLRAGSVWRFKQTPENGAALAAYVESGIGERRNEGYGRVAVNWLHHDELSQSYEAKRAQARETVQLATGDRRLAHTMTTRLLRRQLDAQLEAHVGSAGLQIAGSIENAQLSRLRLVAREAWRANDMDSIPQFLKDLRSPARTQYIRATIDGKDLCAWLNDGWVADLWERYFAATAQQAPAIGDVPALIADELKLEYVVRLIDGLCNKAIRAKRNDKSKEAAA